MRCPLSFPCPKGYSHSVRRFAPLCLTSQLDGSAGRMRTFTCFARKVRPRGRQKPSGTPVGVPLGFGLPERIRTFDLQSRSLTRYPAVPRADIQFFEGESFRIRTFDPPPSHSRLARKSQICLRYSLLWAVSLRKNNPPGSFCFATLTESSLSRYPAVPRADIRFRSPFLGNIDIIP